MAYKWTTEQRAAQAEQYRRVKPWSNATGPKTKRGKKKVSQNACKPATVEMLLNARTEEEYRRIYRRIFRRRRATL